jgi:hypothetical protein
VDAWNHTNYCVAPAHLAALCEAIEALFPWTLIARKPDLVGYRLGDDLNRGALYLRPTAAAAALHDALSRVRTSDVGLAQALAAMDEQDTDLNDHQGILLRGADEWERRVARAGYVARTRPELRVRLVHVVRPGDAGALTGYLYQASVRLDLLGPLRNTFELQALAPGGAAVR